MSFCHCLETVPLQYYTYTLPNNLFFVCNFSNFSSNAKNEYSTQSHSDEHVPYICTRHSIFITAIAFSLLCAEIIASLDESPTATLHRDKKTELTEFTEPGKDETAGRSE